MSGIFKPRRKAAGKQLPMATEFIGGTIPTGVKPLAKQAILEVVKDEAPAVYGPEHDVALHSMIAYLAGFDTDRARVQNGVGFNKLDTERGNRLARTPIGRWPYRDKAWAHRRIRLYRRQLEAGGLAWHTIPEPPPPPLQSPEKWIRLLPTGGFFRIEFHHVGDEFSAIHGDVRYLPSRQFIREDNCWLVPWDSVTAKALRAFAIKHEFDLGPGVDEKFFELIEKAADAIHLARAKEPINGYELGPEVLGRVNPLNPDGSPFVPMPHQVAGVQYIELQKGLCIVGDEMGSGKTILVLLAALKMGVFDEDRVDGKRPRMLFIVPSGAKPTIARAIRHVLPWAKVVVIQGTEYQDLNADVVICNPDVFRMNRVAEVAPIVELFKMVPWSAIVVDEAHYFKGWNTMRTIVLRKLLEAQDIPFRICMSGTIVVNRTSEFVTSMEVTKLLEHFGGTGRFVAEYCGRSANALELHNKLLEKGYLIRMVDPHVFTPDGAKMLELDDVPDWHLPKDMLDRYEMAEIRPHLERYGYRWEAGVLDLPKGTRYPLVCELSPPLRARWDYYEKHFQEWLKEVILEAGGDVEGWNNALRAEALVRINKGRQLVGELKAESAIETLKEMVESGEKVIAYCIHDTLFDKLVDAFPTAAKIHGGDGSRRQKNIDYFMEDLACRILIAKMKAGGEGIDGLQRVCHTMLFFELGWNPAAHSQPERRIRRGGQKHRVKWYYGTAPATIDAYMADVINKKRPIVNGASYGLDVPHDSTVAAVLNAYIADMQSGRTREDADLGISDAVDDLEIEEEVA